MSFWFWHGLRSGVRSTRYPGGREPAAGISPGRPVKTELDSAADAASAAASCPTGAIVATGKIANVDLRTCIHCQRCRWALLHPVQWRREIPASY